MKRLSYQEKIDSFKLDSYLISYLDGLIIGDGNLTHMRYKEKSKISAGYPRYRQQNELKSELWLNKIQKDLEKYNIKSSIITVHQKERYIRGKKYPECNAKYLQTRGYPQFIYLLNKWYDNRIKIIPKNINITPQFMANWYMGDGSLSKWNDRKKIIFHTEGFNESEVKSFILYLNKKLNIHFTLSHKDNKPVIQLATKKDINTLLKYMSPFKVECFNYKWG
jgi:hypothetical protein